MQLIDAHCHLEKKQFPALEEIVSRARDAGLVHAVVIGQWHAPGDFGTALEVAQEAPGFLSPTMGIHPHDAGQATPEDWATLEMLCARPEVRAVGETGLDFFYNHSVREAQIAGFRRHCALANALHKPLVVHVRDAHAEAEEVLRSEGVERAVIHCFTGNSDDARRYLDLGCFLSISGIVTYPKTEPLSAAVTLAPLDRLMVETDSPYLAPVPHRGKKNEPAHVAETARKVAALKGLDADAVALACAKNTAAFFDLPVKL